MLVKTVGVVGCGGMGAGIAEVAAVAGFGVVVVKATPGSLDGPRRRIEGSLDRAVAKERLSKDGRDAAWSRLCFAAELDALAGCDLVVESTAESLAVKRRVLSLIEAAVGPEAIIATNTSSLPLEELASALAKPSRFLGLHFFSPVPAMKLVEVGRPRGVDADAVARACLFVEKLGKTPVILGDAPGYVVNRLLVPYLCHAIESLETGVARAEEIDTAMKLGCGHPVGPLALADLIGLDIVFAMAQVLSAELRDKRFKPPTLLRRLVLAGNLGKKTGLGLYDYRGSHPVENAEIDASLRSPGLRHAG